MLVEHDWAVKIMGTFEIKMNVNYIIMGCEHLGFSIQNFMNMKYEYSPLLVCVRASVYIVLCAYTLPPDGSTVLGDFNNH